MKERIDRFYVKEELSVREAMKRLDDSGRGILIFLNQDNTIKGIITDGDVRRAILNNVSLDKSSDVIINKKPVTANASETRDDVIRMLKEIGRGAIPIVDNDKKFVDIVFLDEFYSKNKANKNIPVIIMAGGRGTRLDPFTKILPKALIPLNDEPIIETIMRRFNKFGFENFTLSVNHKKEFIKMYFNYNKFDFNISFIEEEKPLGTIGALSLIKNKLKDNFFVTNCDTVINADFDEILDIHKKSGNVLTAIACMKETRIPYGVIELDNNTNSLKSIREKPVFHNLILVGIYVLNKKVLDYIPNNRRYDINNLIEKLIEGKEKIGIYPITQHNWFDVGQWEEYNETIKTFNNIKK